jgi:hypothetical protein
MAEMMISSGALCQVDEPQILYLVQEFLHTDWSVFCLTT